MTLLVPQTVRRTRVTHRMERVLTVNRGGLEYIVVQVRLKKIVFEASRILTVF